MILKTLSLFLQRLSDFQLIGTAMDGFHALRYSAELKPDLVLMDLQLPGMNGLEITRRLKVCSSTPAVIMITSEDTPECRAAAIAAGADGFVGKQDIFTQLLPTMRTLFPENANRHS